jgi:hypothetical protein
MERAALVGRRRASILNLEATTPKRGVAIAVGVIGKTASHLHFRPIGAVHVALGKIADPAVSDDRVQ